MKFIKSCRCRLAFFGLLLGLVSTFCYSLYYAQKLYEATYESPENASQVTAVTFKDESIKSANVKSASIQSDESYGQIPLSFEANQGQTDNEVRFISRGNGYRLFLTETQAILSLRRSGEKQPRATEPFSIASATKARHEKEVSTIVGMRLTGGAEHPRIKGLDELPGKVNYFIGNDPSKWRTNVSTYSKVKYENVYPGVDLVYHGNQRELEYDFVVNPGTDPSVIRLNFVGAHNLQIDHDGNLVLHTNAGRIVQPKPLIFQDIGNSHQQRSGEFVIVSNNVVGFKVGEYDSSKPIIIDPPVLVFSSFLGGSGPEPGSYAGIAVDSSGNAYITGETFSSNFPGTFNPVYNYDEAFITKINAAGSAILYSTYLGGSSHDAGNSIAVDSSGNAYVVGETSSANFPTTAGAYQRSLSSVGNAFVTKFNSTGSVIYSTLLGGNGTDKAYGVAVDSFGNAYVTGFTFSTTFPVSAGAYQTTKAGDADVFITKLNVTGSNLVYSTYLGGTAEDDGTAVSVDASGNAYVTGLTYSTSFPKTVGAFQVSLGSAFNSDAFVTKLSPSGSTLVYSTFLGGNFDDVGYGLAVDALGSAYVTGRTSSSNFYTSPGAFQSSYKGNSDVFVTKFNAAGTSAIYSTYIGGNFDDVGRAIAIDSTGYAYITGYTFSRDFPRVGQLPQSNQNFGNSYDAFVAQLDTSGNSLKYCTYVGGADTDAGYGIALDSLSNAYVIGKTESNDFPRQSALQNTAGGGTNDAFILKIAPERTLTVTSINPTIGVLISASPNDNNGQGSGSTTYTRTYNHNTNVTLTAPPTASNGGITTTFQKWQRDNIDVSTSQSLTVAMDADHTVTAVFTSIGNTVTTTVQTNPASLGVIVDGISYTAPKTFTWNTGSNHTIGTTSPQSGGTGTQYVWSNWNDSGAISHTVSPSSNTTYTANFVTQYLLTMNAGTGGTVNPPSGYFNSGQSVSISASPITNYSFSGWTGSGSGSYSGTNNPAAVTMNGPITEAASFTTTPPPPSSNVVVSTSAGGTVNATLTATPNAGYKFLNWTENGNVISTSPTYSFPVANRNLVANFVVDGGPPPPCEDVVWTNLVGVSPSGNTLTKTASDGWGNGGAWSTRGIGSGDGYLEFTATETNKDRMVGLSSHHTNLNYSDIDFAVDFSPGGVAWVFESGAGKGVYVTYQTNDTFRIGIENGVVKFRKNGNLFYSSSVGPTYPLVAEASFFSNGATIANARLCGNLVNVGTNGAPLVTTSAATSVTNNSATLNAAVNPNGSATTAWFEWGTDPTLANNTQTTLQSIGSGTTSQAISANLSGLGSGIYYFRAAASNSAGPAKGSILSFVTGDLPTEPVVWTNLVGVSASGNNLTKTAPDGWGNAGASSTRGITSGDGYLEFTASETNRDRMIGFDSNDINQNYTELRFAIDLSPGGVAWVFQSGVSTGFYSNYQSGDVFRISIESGQVKYRKNGTVFYSSTLSPVYPMLVDTSLFSNGSTLSNVMISGNLQTLVPVLVNVVWTNAVGVSVQGNTLVKTAADSWTNAGAVSSQAIPSGDGYIEFTATETNKDRMCGLSNGDTNQSYQDIDYAIDLAPGGTAWAFELGTSKGISVSYLAGDKFRVAIEGGVVKYSKNGNVFYTSSRPPVYPLLVDTSLFTTGSTITNAMIFGRF